MNLSKSKLINMPPEYRNRLPDAEKLKELL